jgi:DnaJ-class molecular chaperone
MKKTCEICSGTGQISFFKGVSRFLLSREECPECCGTGYQPEIGFNEGRENIDRRTPQKGKKKKGGGR